MRLPDKWYLQNAATQACIDLGIDPYTMFQRADGAWVNQWELMAEDIRRHIVVGFHANRVVLES